jgi:hypothetical protein
MATKAEDGNTAVQTNEVHDRVAMLSLSKDGTPDQTNPEIIGDKDFAVDAAKRQFAEQAVSAIDDAERSVATGAEEVAQDPAIEALKKKHDSAASAAEKRAESVVNSLHKG